MILSERKAELAREKETARLRELILQAETTTMANEESCLWCAAPVGQHTTDCPAFSAPGVVR